MAPATSKVGAFLCLAIHSNSTREIDVVAWFVRPAFVAYTTSHSAGCVPNMSASSFLLLSGISRMIADLL